MNVGAVELLVVVIAVVAVVFGGRIVRRWIAKDDQSVEVQQLREHVAFQEQVIDAMGERLDRYDAVAEPDKSTDKPQGPSTSH